MQAYIDAINGHKLQRGHGNHAWLSLDLLDIFCQLAERGHASSVRSILDYPLKHCPEILLLGMAHINVKFNGFCFTRKKKVLSILYNILFHESLLSGKFAFLAADCVQPPPA